MKKIIALFLALSLVLSLGACSNGTSTGGDSPAGDKTKVTVWATYTEAQLEYLEKTAADFNATHDNIEVVVEFQERNDFAAKVMNAVRNNVGPDIIIDYASTAANYVADGLVASFDQYVPSDFASTVDAGTLAEATSFADGQMHILPLFTSGPVFFYNADLYGELSLTAPTTWAELTANCEAIKAAYPDKYGFAADSLTDMGQTLFCQAGNTIVDGANKVSTFNTPEVAKMVNWFADNVKAELFMLNPTDQYFSNDFNTGVLASYIGSVAGVPYLDLNGEEDGQGNIGIAPLPQGEAVEWTPAWNRGVIVFKSNETEEAAAAEYALYLADAEVNAGFCAVANYASPYAATRETATYKTHIEGNEALGCLRPDTAGAFPAIGGVQTIRDLIQQVLTQVSSGVSDADSALANAETTANAELAAN